MLRIKGGPMSKDIKVYNIEDGIETEITGILSIRIDRVVPGLPIEATIEFLGVELDLLADRM